MWFDLLSERSRVPCDWVWLLPSPRCACMHARELRLTCDDLAFEVPTVRLLEFVHESGARENAEAGRPVWREISRRQCLSVLPL